MIKHRDSDQASLISEYSDLVGQYLELQRLRLEVKKAELQQYERERLRRRFTANKSA
jgi:hypothetical protein